MTFVSRWKIIFSIKLQRMRAIQSSSLDIKLSVNNLSNIQSQLAARMNLAAKELASRVGEIIGGTVRELFNAVYLYWKMFMRRKIYLGAVLVIIGLLNFFRY